MLLGGAIVGENGRGEDDDVMHHSSESHHYFLTLTPQHLVLPFRTNLCLALLSSRGISKRARGTQLQDHCCGKLHRVVGCHQKFEMGISTQGSDR